MDTTTKLSAAAAAYLDAVNGGVQTVNVQWQGSTKPAAAHKSRVLTKVVSATVMTGVEYKNLRVNAERETGDLPWGQWAVYPHIVEHKGTEYARLYTVDGTLRATYFVDGRLVTKAEFDGYLTPSARSAKRPHGGTVTVKVANLTLA